ncbi:MAG: glycosyltransferase family A protein [Candidatus Shapirobacteria bacterium]|jgi:hypothetical protein
MRVNKSDFDWEWYVKFYPDLVPAGIDDERKACEHYRNFGKMERRGANETDLKRIVEANIRHLKKIENEGLSIGEKIKGILMKEKPLINILTRTAGRPVFFKECRQSVVNQTYVNVRQIIGIDDKKSMDYLGGINKRDIIEYPRLKRKKEADFPYNLYLNRLIKEVKEGWVMYLDDDDMLVNKYSLEKLATYLLDENTLYVWKVWFPNKTVPSLSFGKKIVRGDVTGTGFIFHSKHKDKSNWTNNMCGDYGFIKQLSEKLKVRWIDKVLTRSNYVEAYHANNGNRRDK